MLSGSSPCEFASGSAVDLRLLARLIVDFSIGFSAAVRVVGSGVGGGGAAICGKGMCGAGAAIIAVSVVPVGLNLKNRCCADL